MKKQWPLQIQVVNGHQHIFKLNSSQQIDIFIYAFKYFFWLFLLNVRLGFKLEKIFNLKMILSSNLYLAQNSMTNNFL